MDSSRSSRPTHDDLPPESQRPSVQPLHALVAEYQRSALRHATRFGATGPRACTGDGTAALRETLLDLDVRWSETPVAPGPTSTQPGSRLERTTWPSLRALRELGRLSAERAGREVGAIWQASRWHTHSRRERRLASERAHELALATRESRARIAR